MKLLPKLTLALLAGLAGSGCDDSGSTGFDASTQQAPQSLPVQVMEVAPRDLSRTVQISGRIEPMRTIRLAARTDGVLTDVLVEEGDRVEAGQVVARIDVREQAAELSRARANLEEKQANFRRLDELEGRDYVDAASYEAARAALATATSEVELWQARVDFGTVTASIDGTIVARHVEPGEAVAQHAPLFSLADLDSLVVRVGVSELDVRTLDAGDSVPLRVDAVAELNPVPGRIRRIFPAAEEDSRLITVEIELEDAREYGIRPGYLARAELLVDHRPDVLAVPANSVAESAGSHYVMVVDSDLLLARRTVEPGIIRGTWREITAGLEPGDKVVAANPREMSEGESVRIVDWTG